MVWWEQLTGFSKAVVKQLSAGAPQASEEEREKRAKICETCPLIDKKNYRCKKCGCFLRYKISWQTSSCPEGKW